jgi:hypothetical protein
MGGKISLREHLPKAEGQRRRYILVIFLIQCDGAPGQTRTGDPLLRRQTLYPTELRALSP